MPIPRIIIQTHRDPAIGAKLRQTWMHLHPDYEYRFYNNDHCRQFFSQCMPELLPTYDKLPLPVQKADLFRYAVVYWYGGIYADVDTICRAPLDSYINMDQDQLVVGLEMTPAIYQYGMQQYTAHYSSPGQLLQWTFAASPRHPALAQLLAKIRFMVQLNSREEVADYSRHARYTLELTGPMSFTHTLHDYMCLPHHPKVTVLPQLYWGHNPWHNTGIALQDPAIKVRHLYHGSWKAKPAARHPPELATPGQNQPE